ncbi:MAG: 5'-nucleotidase C-terminal domain-containing protein [Myxococcales bacterium]|nr:5'-nucleotidase C-terminal domain-containing protein [Myxococcales bacterium]
MIRGRTALSLCLLGLVGCEAEPARVPVDQGRADAGRLPEAGLDRGPVDAATDGGTGADAGDEGTGPADMGVACGDFLPGAPSFRFVLLHAGGSASALLSPDDTGGAARFVTRVRRLQADARDAEEATVVTVGSGDSFLAGATFAVSRERGVPFLGGLALASAGFDAIALGNHDFDFGPAILADFVRSTARTDDAPAPDDADAGVADAGVSDIPDPPAFLITNLDVSAEPALQALVDDRRLVRQRVIRDRGHLIGVISATTDHLADESSPGRVAVRPTVSAVQAEIDALTDAGVAHIVLVAHLDAPQAELALVQQLTGVDVLVSGAADELRASGQARLLEGDAPVAPYVSETCDAEGRRVRVVTVPGGYRYVGRLIVDFDAEGHIARVDPRSDPLRVIGGDTSDAVPPDPWVAANVEAPLRAALATLADNEVGQTEVALDGRRASLRAGETNLGDLVADALQWAVEELVWGTDDPPADVAIMNGGGIRINQVVPAGAVTELDTFAMLPFASFVVRLPAVSRDELKAVLENAFSQVEDGAGRFPQVAGMLVEWQADAPARQLAPDGTVLQVGNRVRRVVLDDGSVIVQDGVVRPGPPLVVATIDFLARGGDQYPFTGAFEAFGVSYQQALRDFVAGALEGRIDAASYPEGAESRVRRLR